jgi:hypothetical protein
MAIDESFDIGVDTHTGVVLAVTASAAGPFSLICVTISNVSRIDYCRRRARLAGVIRTRDLRKAIRGSGTSPNFRA